MSGIAPPTPRHAEPLTVQQQPQQQQPQQQQRPLHQRRRLFAIGSAFRYRFPADRRQLLEWCVDAASGVVEMVVYWLGPILIGLASSIICLMLYVFLTIMLPMMVRKHGSNHPVGPIVIFLHCALVLYLLVQIVFNYYRCVVQKHAGPLYDRVVHELAEAMDFVYPESTEALALHRRNVSDLLKVRIQRQREEGRRAWMLQGPFEWGYCTHSNQAKPPRSHYDHVVKALVLNLDHYCPWMFNAGEFVFFSC
jgi:DHHC palmitoyltransferase